MFTGFREWLFPNRINMEDGLGGCLVVWGAGRGCSQALRAPRRFAGSHVGWILLDLIGDESSDAPYAGHVGCETTNHIAQATDNPPGEPVIDPSTS